MICSRSDCPIERKARAAEDIRRERMEKHGVTYRVTMEAFEHCAMCGGELIGWRRCADGSFERIGKSAA